MSTSLSPDEIAKLIAKDKLKSRPWHTNAETTRFRFDGFVAVRDHFDDFYQRVDECLDDFLLDNPLRRQFELSMRDGTAHRRDAGYLTTAGYFDASGTYVQLKLPKASSRIRDFIRTQYTGRVVASGSSNTMVFRWDVAAARRGDQIGWYPNDHHLELGLQGPADNVTFAADAGDAMFETFVSGLARFPPIAGWVTVSKGQWNRKFDHDNKFLDSPPDGEPFTAGYHWALFIPNADLDALGGRDSVIESAPVDEAVSVEPVDGSRSPGIAVRPCRDINTINDRLLEEWREYLAPVLHLAPPTQPSGQEIRPVDVLERDWLPA